MGLIRIREVVALENLRARLTLSNEAVVERDLSPMMIGPVFEPIRRDPRLFRQARVEGGTLVWSNGADLCPDVVIWGGAPPDDASVSDLGTAEPHRA